MEFGLYYLRRKGIMNCLINKVGKIGKIKKWCIGFICCFLITASLEVLFNMHSIFEGYEAVSVLASMKERNDFGINISVLSNFRGG